MGTLTEVEKIRKAKRLKNFAPLDVHVWSMYPEVNRAVDALYDEIKKLPEFGGNERLRKKHVKVVVLDLYVKWLSDKDKYSGYYRKRNKYSEMDARYNKLHISRLTVSVVDALERLGYVENHIGHYDYGRTGHKSYMSRMKAKTKLINLIVKKHRIKPEMVERAPNTECIILRDYDDMRKKQIDIPYTDNDETKRMRKELYAYNNLLRRTHIDIPYFPAEGVLSRSGRHRIKINHHDKFVRRIFNNANWEDGGRFYGGWWQRLPKDWRERIRIFGLPTHEIDYSGLHIVIMYALVGIDYWKDIGIDPYRVKNFEKSERMRDLLKQVLLTSINAKSKLAAVRAVNWEVRKNEQEKYAWLADEEIDIGELIDKFAEAHDPIKPYFFSNYGVKLQRIDSMMAEYVINEMTKRELPVLCIHDSFIVPSPHAETLQSYMEEAFHKALETLSDLDEKARSRISRMGMDSDKFFQLWEEQQDFLEPEKREHALRGLGFYSGPDLKAYDLDYQRRMSEFMEIKWEEEYYREKVNV